MLHTHSSAHETLRSVDISRQVLVQGTVPLAVINQPRILSCNYLLETSLVAAESEAFKCTVGSVQNYSRRCLVHLARFDAHQAVLDMVNTPNAILPRELVQRFNQHRPVQLFAIESDRDAMLKGDLQVTGRNQLGIGIGSPGIDLFRWLCPGVFQNTTFHTAAP